MPDAKTILLLSHLANEGRTSTHLAGDVFSREGRMARDLHAVDYTDASALVNVLPLGMYSVGGLRWEIQPFFEGEHILHGPDMWSGDDMSDEAWWAIYRAVANQIAKLPKTLRRLAEIEAELDEDDRRAEAVRAAKLQAASV